MNLPQIDKVLLFRTNMHGYVLLPLDEPTYLLCKNSRGKRFAYKSNNTKFYDSDIYAIGKDEEFEVEDEVLDLSSDLEGKFAMRNLDHNASVDYYIPAELNLKTGEFNLSTKAKGKIQYTFIQTQDVNKVIEYAICRVGNPKYVVILKLEHKDCKRLFKFYK